MAFWEEQVKKYSKDPDALRKELDRARKIIKAKKEAGLDTSEQSTYYNKIKAIGEGAGVDEVGDPNKNYKYGNVSGNRSVRTRIDESTGDIYETERGRTRKIYSAPRDSSNYNNAAGEDYINNMYSNSRDALVERLRSSFQTQRENLQGEMSKVAPAYKAAKGDVLTQGKQAGKRLSELMRNQAAGDTAQAQLQRNVAMQQNVSDLGAQEQETLDEFGRDLAQLTRQEETEINAGLSELETRRMESLLNNYYKERQFGLQEDQLGLQRDKFDYDRYRDIVADERYNQEYNDEMAYREWKKDFSEKEFEFKQDQWNFDKNMELSQENRRVAEFNARMDALTSPANKDEFAILADMTPEQRSYYNSVSGRLSSMENPADAYGFVSQNIDRLIANMGEAPARLMFSKIQDKAASYEPEDAGINTYEGYKDVIENTYMHDDALGRTIVDRTAISKYLSNLLDKGEDESVVEALSRDYAVEPYEPPSADTGNSYSSPMNKLDPGNFGSDPSTLSSKERDVINSFTQAIKDKGAATTRENIGAMLVYNKDAALEMGLTETEYQNLLNYYNR